MVNTSRNFFDFLNRAYTGKVVEIEIQKLKPSRYQPRLIFDEESLEELTKSILENGLIQPITVRQVDSYYEIIAGERRFRACERAGFESIPCYILSPSESQAAEMALVENIQRENLTAVEEAKSYLQIMRQSSLTQEQVAQKVGKSQSAVANKLRLLNLPNEIQEAVIRKEITERHARALLVLPQEKQVGAYRYIKEHALNVRESEMYIEKQVHSNKSRKRQKTKGFTRNVQIGINSIKQCVQMIQKMGIEVTTDLSDSTEAVEVVIRFPK